MLISIIVLAYNTEKYIKECLESIFHLSGSYKIQLIVVDDCSTDGTRQIISQYASKNIICIFNESNEGAYSAFNKAFSFADGDFIARIDSDDCYCCNFLVDAIAVFQKYSHIGAVYGDISIIDANSKVLSKQNNVNRNGLPKMGNELKSLMANYHIPAPTFIARREAWFEALPLPDGIRLFDWYVSLKIARKWDFYYISKVTANYRLHETNAHHSMIIDKWGEKYTFQILNCIFDDEIQNSDLQLSRKYILSSNYLILADKYFGALMTKDALICYIKGIILNPSIILENSGYIRRIFGALIGVKNYNRIKKIVKYH